MEASKEAISQGLAKYQICFALLELFLHSKNYPVRIHQ